MQEIAQVGRKATRSLVPCSALAASISTSPRSHDLPMCVSAQPEPGSAVATDRTITVLPARVCVRMDSAPLRCSLDAPDRRWVFHPCRLPRERAIPDTGRHPRVRQDHWNPVPKSRRADSLDHCQRQEELHNPLASHSAARLVVSIRHWPAEFQSNQPQSQPARPLA